MRLPDPQRSYAVLIGTSTYHCRELADLPAVRNNLDGLAEVLTTAMLGGLPDDRCIVRHDPTDVRSVYGTLRQYADETRDTLLVYFAGHGQITHVRNELYLALPDTDPQALRVSALPFDAIREVLSESNATNRVLILDCCYSGRVTEEYMSGPDETILGQLDIEGTYILAAAPANSIALAPVGAEYTAFTGELLTLVQTGIPEPEGPELLTYATIYRQLKRTLNARGLPRPGQRNTGTADHLALTRNPAHSRNQHREGPRPRRPPRAARGDLSLTATLVSTIPTKKVHALAFSHGGASLAVATGTNTVRIYDTTSWGQRVAVRQHWWGNASVFTIAFGAIGHELAAGSSVADGGMVQLWDADTGSRGRKIANSTTVWVVAFNRDGGMLATGDHDGNVRIWNAHSGKLLMAFAHLDVVQGVAFSPDGRRLATGSRDRTARIWDVYTGEQQALLAHKYGVKAVALSSDGRLLATASTPALIWDVRTGMELLTLGSEPRANELCNDVAFSPDGRFLAGAFMDHTARIWDTRTGMELLKLTHDTEVGAVAFSPDGRWLATGDGGRIFSGGPVPDRGPGTVRVWQLKNVTTNGEA